MKRHSLHPGEHVAGQLDVPDMSAAERVRKLRVRANRITEILNRQRAANRDTALRAGHFFHADPEFRQNLQAIYELRVAEEGNRAMRSSNCRRYRAALRRGARAIIRRPPEVEVGEHEQGMG